MFMTAVRIALSLLIVTTITACSGQRFSEVNVTSTALPLPEETALAQEPVNTPLVQEPVVNTGESTEAFLEVNFTNVFPLDLNDAYVEQLVAFHNNTLLYRTNRDRDRHSKIVMLELQSGATQDLWESKEESIYRGSFQVYEDAAVKWNVYVYDTEGYKTYHLSAQQQLTQFAGDASDSPDGKWSVYYDRGREGLYGVDITSGEEQQWTMGQHDSQPLWLPDSSGFIYLHDTGEQIGDGAGPYYQLARYEIDSKKSHIYSFPKGFWGYIEWLEPGVSLVAHHGFDDVVAMKVVNLEEEREYFLLETEYDRNYTGYALNAADHSLWISEQGSFKQYNSQGQLQTEVKWPVNLDAYTADQKKEDDEYTRYYGASRGARFAPHHFHFSPGGQKIAYFLGNMGQSEGDLVKGVKIALANADGTAVQLKTTNYMLIQDMVWSQDSSQLAVVFSLQKDEDIVHYIGIIDAL